MNTKYTKEQIKAIDNLILYIDELENKPRRLFYALEEMALAFNKKESVPSIREAQDLMYRHLTEGQQYNMLFESLRDFIIKEWEWQVKNSPEDLKSSELRIKSAEDFVKNHIRNLTNTRFN